MYKMILVAVDFSPHSERAVERAKALVEAFGGQLQLLHIVETPTYPVLEDVAVTGLPGMWDLELTETLIDAAKKRLKGLAKRYGIAEDAIEVLVGLAKVDIVEHAQQIGADLIVVGRHGEGFWESLIGSVADSVLHRASCDVLAVDVEHGEPTPADKVA